VLDPFTLKVICIVWKIRGLNSIQVSLLSGLNLLRNFNVDCYPFIQTVVIYIHFNRFSRKNGFVSIKISQPNITILSNFRVINITS